MAEDITPYLPSFRHLFAVSDLHMGGPPGGQIFQSAQIFANFVQRAIARSGEGPAVLVLNGDTFDLLARGDRRTIQVESVIGAMQEIRREPSFQPVWRALERWVGGDRRHLVFVLGNHDVELAFPHVQGWLRAALAPSEEVRCRLHFATQGFGYSCQVAGGWVHCLHGNGFDKHNRLDFDPLTQLIRAMLLHEANPRQHWKPNFGTHLVVNRLNDLKQRYPFIDLLKPERPLVMDFLRALDLAIYRDLAAYTKQLTYDATKRRVRLLGQEGPDMEGDLEAMDGAWQDPDGERVRFRRQAELDLAQGRDPRFLDMDADEQELLGGRLSLFSPRRGTRIEGLRRKLCSFLPADRSFHLEEGDYIMQALRHKIGDAVRVVIAGHTHLARHGLLFPDHDKGCHYLNTGTWASLIQLPVELVQDQQRHAFRAVCDLFRQGSLSRLLQHRIPAAGGSRPLVEPRCHVAWVRDEDGALRVDLCRVEETGEIRPLPLSGDNSRGDVQP